MRYISKNPYGFTMNKLLKSFLKILLLIVILLVAGYFIYVCTLV